MMNPEMTQAKTENPLEKLRCLDGTVIKLIAIASMLIDHIGALFFPDDDRMRIIGRIAMPVFAFCIAEGFCYTHDRRKYLLRLGLFALVSEVPFDLAFNGRVGFEHQNIMVTFFLSVVALWLYDQITGSAEKPAKIRMAAGVCAVLCICAVALLVRCDYRFFAVLTVWMFYVLRDRAHWLRVSVGCGILTLMRLGGIYTWTILGLLPLICYNGKKGKGLKWLFYVFYPAHLLLLYGIRQLLA